jgi:hypothetical protein
MTRFETSLYRFNKKRKKREKCSTGAKVQTQNALAQPLLSSHLRNFRPGFVSVVVVSTGFTGLGDTRQKETVRTFPSLCNDDVYCKKSVDIVGHRLTFALLFAYPA